MKPLSSLIPLPLLLVACSALLYAQGFRIESNSPQTSATAGSQPFVSLEGRFAVDLPVEVSAYNPRSLDTPRGPVEMVTYYWRTASGVFMIGYVSRTEPLEAIGKPVLDQLRDSILSEVRQDRGEMTSETNVSLNGHPGRALRITFPDSFSLLRIYLAGNRAYQIVATIPNNQKAQEPEVIKILDSFRLLSQAEVSAEIERRVAEATPSPLPQQPVAKKLKSDAEDEGLKGRVKTVTTENEEMSGTPAERRRKPSSIEYYDELGNLVKSVYYDYRGNPFDITVYGYLDGSRVSRSKIINYEYDPPPVVVAPAPGRPAPRSDPRYSHRYKYKYDERGNLVEETMYGGDGSVWSRTVRKFSGNKMEESVYDENGALNQKSLYTLDERGNKVEEVELDPGDGSVKNRYSYAYEFDPAGNWIKQATSEWVTKNGRSFFEPARVTYRTITYY